MCRSSRWLRVRPTAESSPVKITGEITGNDANAERGFHIHTFGDLSNGCVSAGPHWNVSPFMRTNNSAEMI